MNVAFTPSARRQFLDAIVYIRRDKPSAARSFRKEVERKLSRLEAFPESGRRIPEFPDLSFREVLIRPYRFFYKIAGDAVWVVAVWHDAQLAKPPHDPGA